MTTIENLELAQSITVSDDDTLAPCMTHINIPDNISLSIHTDHNKCIIEAEACCGFRARQQQQYLEPSGGNSAEIKVFARQLCE